MDERTAPIFIIGAPRSGTTLLRVILDTHPEVSAWPETPWLSGMAGKGGSLRTFVNRVAQDDRGLVAAVRTMEEEDVIAAGRAFVEELMRRHLERTDASRLAFKTPLDILYLDFLVELLPHAKFIHILRDGRDVALSHVGKKGTNFHRVLSGRRLTLENAMANWCHLVDRANRFLAQADVASRTVRYEELVRDPEAEAQALCEFLGLEYRPEMLDYASARHDFPSWEAGSSDVRARNGVRDDSVGKWRSRRLTLEEEYVFSRYEARLTALGFEPAQIDQRGLRKISLGAYGAMSRAARLCDDAAAGLRWRLRAAR